MESETMQESEPKTETQEKQNPYLIPGSIVTAGVLIALAVVYSNGGLEKKIPANQQSAAVVTSGSAKDLADNDPILGNPEAPVTIVEFGDFQCPFCAQFFRTTEQQVIEQYVKTGKVRFIYRDFPLSGIHEHAQKSAEASECANEQGKFWPYHDILYARQAMLGVANYKVWARELGLNGDQFDQCLDSGKYTAEVQKDFQDGQTAGVTGTPASFINGKLVSGSVPFEAMKEVIEEALKNSQQ